MVQYLNNAIGESAALLQAKELSKISRSSGLGDFTSAITNTYYGINYRGVGNAAIYNNEQYGLTFFTRPFLNLTYDNLRANRTFVPLATNEELSVHRAIRTLLDPRGAWQRKITTPLIDHYNAFMPLLTNNLISLSGWPDLDIDTYTSKPGIVQEQVSFVDGNSRIHRTFDLTANFRNIKGDPISLLFNIWTKYSSLVYKGEMDPYIDMMLENRIDYNTRIYRLTLDPSRQYVQKIAACGAAFPTAAPLGTSFDFNEDQPFATQNGQISIPFKCMGVDYLDPITVLEFNRVTVMFNPSMEDGKREATYRKLTLSERQYFNYRGYPRIDPETYEFQVWINNDLYNYELSGG